MAHEESPPRRAPRAPGADLWLVWARRVLIALILLVGLAFVGVALVIRHYEAQLPSTADLARYTPPQVTRVLAADGSLLGEIFLERRTVVPLAEIPPEVKLAVLAAEDAKFYEHTGLNYLGMLRALAVNLRSTESRQGGSTITQQVVKNVLLSPERTYERKIREVLLARRIEQELTKDQILELYLNHIYFGHGRYGVEEASRYYFGKGVRDVTLAEAALLAAVPKGPQLYSPRIAPARALERRDYVLGQMLDKGFADSARIAKANLERLVLAPEPEALEEIAPEVMSEVRRKLREVVGPAADQGGFVVRTTIVPELQRAARRAVRDNLDAYAERHDLKAPLLRRKDEPKPFEGTPTIGSHHVYDAVVTGADDERNTLSVRVGTLEGHVDLRSATRYNPDKLPASRFAEVGRVLRVSIIEGPKEGSAVNGDDPASLAKLRLELGPQSALVAIDVRTRDVVALVGGYEGIRAGLDRASRSHRQPGSTFKAFVYSYALHARQLTAASMLEADPKLIDGYKVQNYDAKEGADPVLMRQAVAKSVNTAAAWTARQVGPAHVAAWAASLGIESKMGNDLSIALGSYEVTPRELTNAYATFAAGGRLEPARLIVSIEDAHGQSIALPPAAPGRQPMTEAEAFLTTSLLKSVVEEGTGRAARVLGRPIAGKTGTTNDYKDAWFAGYSTDFACVAWTGYDDNLSLGRGESGAKAALPAFIDFMKRAHEGRVVTDFPVPQGIVRVAIDPKTGKLAHRDQDETIREYFLEGTEPTEVVGDDDEDGDEGGGEDPEPSSIAVLPPDEDAPPPF